MTSSSNALDMSLDDLIKNNKKSGRRGRGGGGGGGTSSRGLGPTRRRFANRAANRTTPYARPAFAGGGRSSAIETGTKLYITNLDYGVSNEDLKELFSEIGNLKRYSVDYDRSGRSKGMAQVVYSRRSDALLALKKYNNVQLDGKAMKIVIAGPYITTPAVTLPVTNGMFRKSNGFNTSVQGRGEPSGRPRGGGNRGRGFGRGRGRGRGRGEQVSAEDLDADLEKYHSVSMQIN